MKILIESYPYPKDRLSDGLQSIGREMRGNVYFEEVGYYLSNKIQECVFILPKVLLWDKDKDGHPCTRIKIRTKPTEKQIALLGEAVERARKLYG